VKHQWVNTGDIRVYRVCSQCGYRIPVSRDVDPVAAMAVEDCPGRGARSLLHRSVALKNPSGRP
jgi:RNA polymerase-binding transcription factor DksA